MPKYLVQASYTADGVQGLMKDKATGRKNAVSKTFKALGGKLEAMYYTFGEYDAMVIVDLPDNVSAAAISLAAASSGLVRTKTTPLLTIEETDKALARSVSYRPPGK